jgi:hypothetical protein
VAVGGQAHAAIDIDLPSAAQTSITGRIVTSSGAAPAACVIAIVPNHDPIAVVPTNPDGTFTLGPIDAGSYLIGIAGCDFTTDVPPGITDPVDPSVTYPLQWSSGVALQLDNIWLNPPWVTAQVGTPTDLGTICLSPCPAPTPPAPPAPAATDASPPDPGIPDHLGAGLFDPNGFDVAGPPKVDASAPTGSITAKSIGSIAPRASAPTAKVAAAPAADLAGDVAAVAPVAPPSDPPVPTQFADASGTATSGSAGGTAGGVWFFAGAGLLGLGAALLPKFRARRRPKVSTGQ